MPAPEIAALALAAIVGSVQTFDRALVMILSAAAGASIVGAASQLL